MFLSVAVACTKNLFLWDIGTKLSCHLELGVQTQHLGCQGANSQVWHPGETLY